ncbi:hypothetical protein PG985_014880 [Apiospora marii]|uniref:uncharacterized protein n=1 Tax=Apiospora marii TaxID=335849 RepID=UPI00312E3D96
MNHQTDNGSHAETILKCEIKTWHTREDGKGNKLRVALEGDDANVNDDSGNHALVLDRVFDRKGHLISTTLTVNSYHILQALKDVVHSYPTVAANFTEPFDMSSPFQMLYHHWEDLYAHKAGLCDQEDDDARMHLNLLLAFMKSELGGSKRSIERQFASGRCEFSNAWLLFKPGDVVITHFNAHAWLLKVNKTAYKENHRDGKWLELQCTHTGHDGKSPAETRHTIEIYERDSFAQGHPEDIVKLPAYPRKYHAEDGALEERLRARGDRYMAIVNTRSSWQVWCSYAEKGRVVFDLASYLEEQYGPETSIPRDGSTLDTALCPPYAFGYSCSRKTWGRYLVSNVREATWRPDPMSSLELQTNQKMLIQALVASHDFANRDRDQAEQKGKGLVILLHGPPGSGKTLTAECAAELSQRALLSCSMSELNKHNSAWYFERRLAQVLQLATTWKAVVLLDEADVFLEARQSDSPAHQERKALVAVFLRHLEYFSGIVFLTTNRIHVFDAAMRSRVHLALGYHEPGAAARRAIWSYNIHQLPKEQVDASLGEMLDRLASEALNGREIANTVATANTFARSRKEPLRFHHIETVLAVRRDFEMVLGGVKTTDGIGPQPSS